MNKEQNEVQKYKLDDTAIAGLMQLLTLSIVTGTNLMDHLRLMELQQGPNGQLVMTHEFIAKSEAFAKELAQRVEDDEDDVHELVPPWSGGGS